MGRPQAVNRVCGVGMIWPENTLPNGQGFLTHRYSLFIAVDPEVEPCNVVEGVRYQWVTISKMYFSDFKHSLMHAFYLIILPHFIIDQGEVVQNRCNIEMVRPSKLDFSSYAFWSSFSASCNLPNTR
jgi:hypothetical protein